jgi:flagellar hook-length control protein FliK
VLSPAVAQPTAPPAEKSPAGLHGRKPHAPAAGAAFSDLLAPDGATPPARPVRDAPVRGREVANAAAEAPPKEAQRPANRDEDEEPHPEAGSTGQPLVAPAAPQPASADVLPSPPGGGAVQAEIAGIATGDDAVPSESGQPAPENAALGVSAATVTAVGSSGAGSPGPGSPAAAPPVGASSADVPDPVPPAAESADPGVPEGSEEMPGSGQSPATSPPGAQPHAARTVAVAGPAVGATAGAVGERAAVLVARDIGTKEPSGKPGTRPDGSANPGSGKEAANLEGRPEVPGEGKPADTPLPPDAAASQRSDPAMEPRSAAEARTSGAPGPQPLPSQAAAVTLPQVAVTIATRFKAGESRFQIRLDPAELGRIDVDLTVDKGGQATTTLTVERMDTLDLLQRDSRALERALGAAGFKTDQGSLQFNLRDPGQGSPGFHPGQGHAQDQGAPRRFHFAGPGEGAGPSFRTPATDVHPSRLSRLGGLDIRV